MTNKKTKNHSLPSPPQTSSQKSPQNSPSSSSHRWYVAAALITLFFLIIPIYFGYFNKQISTEQDHRDSFQLSQELDQIKLELETVKKTSSTLLKAAAAELVAAEQGHTCNSPSTSTSTSTTPTTTSTTSPTSSTTSRIQILNLISTKEWETIGQLFMAQKVSEIVMDDETVDTFGLSREALDEAVTLTGFATDLISVHVTKQEIETSTLSDTSVHVLSERLERWGVVALQSVMSSEESLKLAEHIYKAVEAPTYAFGSIMENELRHDYPLEMLAWNTQYYDKVTKLLRPILEKMLGDDAELVEYSSIVSMPGAGEQKMHPDAGMEHLNDLKEWAKVYSIFVYLNDVDVDMAALDVRPGTHTHFHFLIPQEAMMLGSVPTVRMSVPSGSIVIMDSRCHHRGSANNSTKRRPVFYFSLKSKVGKPPTGPTYSIRDQYVGNFTLKDSIVKGNILKMGRKINHGKSDPDSSVQEPDNSKVADGKKQQVTCADVLGMKNCIRWMTSYRDKNDELKKVCKGLQKVCKNSAGNQVVTLVDRTPGSTPDSTSGHIVRMIDADTDTVNGTTVTLNTTAWPLPIGLDYTYDYNDTKKEDMLLSSPTPPKYNGPAMPASMFMPAPVVTIDTLEWATFVHKHPFTLICFYDPRSAAFSVLKDIYPEAASLLKGTAIIAAVNTAKDSFLTSNMAWEMDLADQDPGKDSSFTFGKPNYYPVIVHLYKNGTKLVEYTGVQSAEAISKWVNQMVKSSSGTR